MKILIIEDNVALSKNICEYLEIKKHKVDKDYSGTTGFDKIINNHYDVVIMDINLPGKDGLTTLEELRKAGNNTPILMLTSRNTSQDVVKGLNLGADDYLGKPFSMEELISRLEAIYRRTATIKGNIINHEDIEINIDSRTVIKKGENIELSTLEFNLLKYLLQNKGKVIDRVTLFENVWGDFDDHMLSRSVDMYISYLRKKFGNDFIETKKGVGYVIN